VGSSATDPNEAIRLARDAVERVADRLRSLSDVRLARPMPPAHVASPNVVPPPLVPPAVAQQPSRADAAHALAQLLADLAATAEAAGADAGAEPVFHPVPRLHDLAVGDQVAVTGHDLVEAARWMLDADNPAGEPADANGPGPRAGVALDALVSATAACRGLLRDL
jgi:hypothetical protein